MRSIDFNNRPFRRGLESRSLMTKAKAKVKNLMISIETREYLCFNINLFGITSCIEMIPGADFTALLVHRESSSTVNPDFPLLFSEPGTL